MIYFYYLDLQSTYDLLHTYDLLIIHNLLHTMTYNQLTSWTCRK